MSYNLSRREFLRTGSAPVVARLGGLGTIVSSFDNAFAETSVAASFAEAVAYALHTSKVQVNGDGSYTVETPWLGNEKVKVDYHPEQQKGTKIKVHRYTKEIPNGIAFESDDGWTLSRVIEYDKSGRPVTRTLSETIDRTLRDAYFNQFIMAASVAERYLKGK